MAKVKVGVAGYGVIGQRLADGVACPGRYGTGGRSRRCTDEYRCVHSNTRVCRIRCSTLHQVTLRWKMRVSPYPVHSKSSCRKWISCLIVLRAASARRTKKSIRSIIRKPCSRAVRRMKSLTCSSTAMRTMKKVSALII